MSLVLRVLACAFAALGAFSFALSVQERLAARRAAVQHLELSDFLQDRVLSFVVFAAFGLVAAAASTWWALVPCLILAAYLSRRAPDLLERHARDEHRRACEGELDMLSDTVAMGMKAGLSFDAALALYCDKFSGALVDEMAGARLVWENGLASRERALHDMAGRVGSRELARFCSTVTQALSRGAPLAAMLDAFGQDLRAQRYARLEEQVEKVPVKMLVPTGVCILPAMLILVMGPALLQFLQSGT